MRAVEVVGEAEDARREAVRADSGRTVAEVVRLALDGIAAVVPAAAFLAGDTSLLGDAMAAAV